MRAAGGACSRKGVRRSGVIGSSGRGCWARAAVEALRSRVVAMSRAPTPPHLPADRMVQPRRRADLHPVLQPALRPRLGWPHQAPPVLPLHHPPHDPVHRPALLIPADPLRHLVATPPEDDKVRDHVQQTIWRQQCSHIPLQPAPNLPLLPRARVLPLRPVPRRRPRRAVEGLPPRSSPRLPCSGWVCRIKHELIPVGVE